MVPILGALHLKFKYLIITIMIEDDYLAVWMPPLWHLVPFAQHVTRMYVTAVLVVSSPRTPPPRKNRFIQTGTINP